MRSSCLAITPGSAECTSLVSRRTQASDQVRNRTRRRSRLLWCLFRRAREARKCGHEWIERARALRRSLLYYFQILPANQKCQKTGVNGPLRSGQCRQALERQARAGCSEAAKNGCRCPFGDEPDQPTGRLWRQTHKLMLSLRDGADPIPIYGGWSSIDDLAGDGPILSQADTSRQLSRYSNDSEAPYHHALH